MSKIWRVISGFFKDPAEQAVAAALVVTEDVAAAPTEKEVAVAAATTEEVAVAAPTKKEVHFGSPELNKILVDTQQELQKVRQEVAKLHAENTPVYSLESALYTEKIFHEVERKGTFVKELVAAIPPELLALISQSQIIQRLLAPYLAKWEEVKGKPDCKKQLGMWHSQHLGRKPNKEESGFINALEGWSSSGIPDFISYLLLPANLKILESIMGSQTLAMNREIDLMGWLETTGRLCRIHSVFPHGHQGGKDTDLLVILPPSPGKVHELHPDELEVLTKVFSGPLDITLVILDDKVVKWVSQGVRPVVQAQLANLGVLPELSPEQKEVLRVSRISGLFLLIAKHTGCNNLTKMLTADGCANPLGIATSTIDMACNGGLNPESLEILLKGFVLVFGTLPEKQGDEAKKLLTQILSILKQFLHVNAIFRGDDVFSREELLALATCSEETKVVMKTLLEHEVPRDPQSFEGLLSYIAQYVRTLPLPPAQAPKAEAAEGTA